MASPETELAAGLASLGMEPGQAAAYAAEKSGVVDWEAAAEALATALEPSMEKRLRKAAEDMYSDVLSDVQIYLRDNATFNLGQELESARRLTVEAYGQLERIAQALGLGRRGWPSGRAGEEASDAIVARIEKLIEAEKGVAAAERTALAAGLRERADWLRSEYQKGGSAAHLRPREEEARAVADLIERGRFTAQAEIA